MITWNETVPYHLAGIDVLVWHRASAKRGRLERSDGQWCWLVESIREANRGEMWTLVQVPLHEVTYWTEFNAPACAR
jgi:hypothetical protein